MAKFDRIAIAVTVGGEPGVLVTEGDQVSLVRFANGREQYYSNERIKREKRIRS